MPRGAIHQAEALPGEHSLHVTISVNQRRTWADFLAAGDCCTTLNLCLNRAPCGVATCGNCLPWASNCLTAHDCTNMPFAFV